MPPAAIRHFGAVNGRGLWTLYRRELVRFLRYSWESLGGPAVSSLLFLAVFVLAFGALFVMAVNGGLWALTHRMIATGYRLKA